MINDIKLTVDLKKQFIDHLTKENIPKTLEFYVKVLHEANWPAYKNLPVVLPPAAF